MGKYQNISLKICQSFKNTHFTYFDFAEAQFYLRERAKFVVLVAGEAALGGVDDPELVALA